MGTILFFWFMRIKFIKQEKLSRKFVFISVLSSNARYTFEYYYNYYFVVKQLIEIVIIIYHLSV